MQINFTFLLYAKELTLSSLRLTNQQPGKSKLKAGLKRTVERKVFSQIKMLI
jgi:hypothetical protein